jgi:hypothetical protein
MRWTHLLYAIAFTAALALPRVASACPACADAVPATSGADEDDSMREARAYNQSIYLMAGMPYLCLGGFSAWVYRGLRRKAVADARFTEEANP